MTREITLEEWIRRTGMTPKEAAAYYGVDIPKLIAHERRGEGMWDEEVARRPEYTGLSSRALNSINNTVGLDKDTAETARQLRCIGRREFMRQPNVGKVTCDEVMAWAWAQFPGRRSYRFPGDDPDALQQYATGA